MTPAIPTNADILAALAELDRRVGDDLETAALDFKRWTGTREDMRTAAEYAAMANADGGVIVFGVDNKAPGRAAAIHGAKGYDVDAWRRGIYDGTNPKLAVKVEEMTIPEGTGRVLVVLVPKGAMPPYGTSGGLFKVRVGKNCVPLDPRELLHARVLTAAVDWSGEPVESAGPDMLDPVEIARARNWLRRLRQSSDLLRLSDAELLRGLGAVTDGKVTRAGLLLFGKEDELRRRCPQHTVQYIYQTSETAVARNDWMHVGLLQVLERIEQAFTGPANPEHELSFGLAKLRIPSFSVEDTVREAVLNAVTHRDYLDTGRVIVRHEPTRLTISSPGGFTGGVTPANILRHEPVSRNLRLAMAFVKLGLVEQAGVGRRRIFIPMLSYGKRIPTYEADGSSVTLRIYDGSFDERMARLVAKWRGEGREISLDSLLILTHLKEHAFINAVTAAELLQLPRNEVRGLLDSFAQPSTGILERRGNTAAATFHLTKAVARDLIGKAGYTKNRGINPIRYAEMVKAFVADHGSITPREVRELLGLGESQTAKVEASRLLRGWRGPAGFLRQEGKARNVRYFPLPSAGPTL